MSKVWRIRPSSAARVVACPGSVQICADAPAYMDEDGDNEIREEGTACHWHAHGLAIGNPAPVGAVAPNGVAITQEMQEGAELYLRAVGDWGAQQVYFETPLAIADVADCGGTPDAFALTRHVDGAPLINVGDLKFGFRTVDVWPNFQLIAYGVGVARYFYVDPANCWYRFMIAQPRRWHAQGRVRSALVHGSQVMPYLQTLQAAVHAAMQPNAPLVPGTHCDYCVGRARCGALRDKVSGTYVAPPHDLALPEAEAELQFLRRHRRLVDAYVSGLEAQVEHALRNGARSQRYELVRKTGRRAWSAADVGKISALAKLMGVNLEKPTELITPTQALDLLPAEIVNMYSSREQGALTLMEQDASRWDAIFGKK